MVTLMMMMMMMMMMMCALGGDMCCAGGDAGYLEAAYKAVRAEGGLCISDEVQSGFGSDPSYYLFFLLICCAIFSVAV
eukprot:1157238-Rhodomonas_salina.1